MFATIHVSVSYTTVSTPQSFFFAHYRVTYKFANATIYGKWTRLQLKQLLLSVMSPKYQLNSYF